MITVNNRLTVCLRYNKTEIEADAVIMVYRKAKGLLGLGNDTAG
jgi:hypothetical protein